MRFKFKLKKLENLYTKGEGVSKYPLGVMKLLQEVIYIVDSIDREQDLFTYKSLIYEKLKGNRQNQHSMCLNDRYQLVVQQEQDDAGKFVLIIDIVDGY